MRCGDWWAFTGMWLAGVVMGGVGVMGLTAWLLLHRTRD